MNFKRPMLATLTQKRFSHKDWIFECKLDGVRCIVVKKGKSVNLYSRNRKKLNTSFPELVIAFQKQSKENFVIDGEIVTFENKISSFSKLQNRLHVKKTTPEMQRKTPVYFYAFDLLSVDNIDATKLNLIERKALLRKTLSFTGRIRFLSHRRKEGEKHFKEAAKKGWEGLIAKNATSKYYSSRTRNWLKFKCIKRQKFIIGGFTDPEGGRVGFGALLIGHYVRGKLKFAGKVGTGYDDALLAKLGARLHHLECKTSPFSDKKTKVAKGHWTRPKLACEVGFTEWTDDGKLRHPRFIKVSDGIHT